MTYRPRIDEQAGNGWILGFDHYDPADERRREAILALGNGYFVTRAAAPWVSAGARHYPGTYRAGCYDRLSSRIAGETVDIETVVNLPNWLPLTFRLGNGGWFDMDEAALLNYSHELNLASGATRRTCRFRDRQGRLTHLSEQRLVSMAQPHIAALRMELTAENWSGPVEFLSSIDGTVVNANVQRYADYADDHLLAVSCDSGTDGEVRLVTRTRQSAVQIEQIVRTSIDGAPPGDMVITDAGIRLLQSHRVNAACGEPVVIEKIMMLSTTSPPELPDAAAPNRVTSGLTFTGLYREHTDSWRRLWERVGIDLTHDTMAKSLRFQAFHILQTASPYLVDLDLKFDTGIPARGWHGEAYRGHIFWDEMFVLPFLNCRFPELARALLLYRYRRLEPARSAAQAAGYRGAMFPWRSASGGSEVTPRHQLNLLSGHWLPDHTHLQRHIGSAIAVNVWRYFLATGDMAFLIDYGAEILIEIARFWASIAEYKQRSGRYEITGIVGPDEYHDGYPGASSPGLDNNAYTNLMAAWALQCALELHEHIPGGDFAALRNRLALTDDELAHWADVSCNMYVPFLANGVIAQFDGFDRLRPFQPDTLPDAIANHRADWALEAVGERADSYQVTKQADLLTVLYLLPMGEVIALLSRLGYQADEDTLRRTADYYLARTAHESSLSRAVYAGALAQLDPPRSWRLFCEALATDRHPLKGESTAEGIHLGAMGGTLDVLQRLYVGISAGIDGLRLDPAMPPELGEVCLRVRHHDHELTVTSSCGQTQIFSAASNNGPVSVCFRLETYTLRPGEKLGFDSTRP